MQQRNSTAFGLLVACLVGIGGCQEPVPQPSPETESDFTDAERINRLFGPLIELAPELESRLNENSLAFVDEVSRGERSSPESAKFVWVFPNETGPLITYREEILGSEGDLSDDVKLLAEKVIYPNLEDREIDVKRLQEFETDDCTFSVQEFVIDEYVILSIKRQGN